MAEGTLNNKIEIAWRKARQAQPEARKARRDFQTRFCHLAADQLGTSPERVRDRVLKIERIEAKPIVIDTEALDQAVAQAGRPDVRKTLILLGLGRYLDEEKKSDG